jgi:hypothetical protein
MPIKIKFPSPDETAEKKVQAQIHLKIKKTLDDNLLINDHEYMDIVVVPKKHKIITFPKPHADKDVYEYQKDLLYSLFKGGVLEMFSAEGGARFGVLEATYPAEASVDSLQAVLLQVQEYLKKTAADELVADEYDENIEDNFTDPPDDKTTKYGSIPPYQDTPAGSASDSAPYTYAGYGYLY